MSACKDGYNEYELIKPEDCGLSYHVYTENHGDKFSDLPDDKSYWYSGDIKRNDPLLVEVVRKLGKAANGQYAALKIVEIPDAVQYEISEYDGNENVAERHSTWN